MSVCLSVSCLFVLSLYTSLSMCVSSLEGKLSRVRNKKVFFKKKKKKGYLRRKAEGLCVDVTTCGCALCPVWRPLPQLERWTPATALSDPSDTLRPIKRNSAEPPRGLASRARPLYLRRRWPKQSKPRREREARLHFEAASVQTG